MMIAYTHVGYTLGMLFLAILNTLMPWRMVACCCILIPILTTVRHFDTFVDKENLKRKVNVIDFYHFVFSPNLGRAFLCEYSIVKIQIAHD